MAFRDFFKNFSIDELLTMFKRNKLVTEEQLNAALDVIDEHLCSGRSVLQSTNQFNLYKKLRMIVNKNLHEGPLTSESTPEDSVPNNFNNIELGAKEEDSFLKIEIKKEKEDPFEEEPLNISTEDWELINKLEDEHFASIKK